MGLQAETISTPLRYTLKKRNKINLLHKYTLRLGFCQALPRFFQKIKYNLCVGNCRVGDLCL